jgi:hypothetical protein
MQCHSNNIKLFTGNIQYIQRNVVINNKIHYLVVYLMMKSGGDWALSLASFKVENM